MYKVILSKQAKKDAILIKHAKLDQKVKIILKELIVNPYSPPYNFEALRFDLTGFYSKRINIKHRLIYRIDEETREVIIVRMWSNYDKIK